MNDSPVRRRRHHRYGYRVREFTRRLAEKCEADEVLFMAGAIAFNLVMSLFPLLILGIGIAGYALSRFADPTQAAVDLVTVNLPQGAGTDLRGLIEGLTQALLERRTGYAIAGTAFFLWIATNLSASLRVALRETFDVGAKRNAAHGKLFDVVAVMVGMLLLTLNLGVTIVGATAMEFGMSLFGLEGQTLSLVERGLGLMVAFVSIWVLLLLAYRYMPARPIQWRTAMVAATFTAVVHETLKFGVSWYATDVADYGSALGNLATVALLFFWIYYEALVFILGGEVAQVSTMRRASRVGVVSFEAGGE